MFSSLSLTIVTLFHVCIAAVTPGSLSLIEPTSFANPTNASFNLYVPKALAAKPALLVAVHYCTGNGPAFYRNTQYAKFAETHGFIVVYPGSPNAGTCWDVSSAASLSNTEKGDSGSIIGMVKWTLKNYPAIDKTKVFLVGESSGAMMTNVLSAAYPNIFTASIAYAGVPAGCFVATGKPLAVAWWNSTCSTGKSIATPALWAATAKAMGPKNYKGSRPKMLIYHGGKDGIVNPQNYEETIKQWSGVFGYEKPISIAKATPAADHVTTTYGPLLKGVLGANQPHSLTLFPNNDMAWFGFT
ncbi:putative acetyl xylan esterase [Venturia nashicola]|uniref:Putative acetyl xylan esterase n=1 Tax=Venturia nashicola TaxID=86259 RepID=A0A4Z1NHV0_9PEZI|nr:putative acetyl xylan esterase [Venturia nashicola]TLD21648.1 putative acetyl xylan esterase [Venturia nashicola]